MFKKDVKLCASWCPGALQPCVSLRPDPEVHPLQICLDAELYFTCMIERKYSAPVLPIALSSTHHCTASAQEPYFAQESAFSSGEADPVNSSPSHHRAGKTLQEALGVN